MYMLSQQLLAEIFSLLRICSRSLCFLDYYPWTILFFTCGAAGCVYIHATSSHFRQFVSGMET